MIKSITAIFMAILTSIAPIQKNENVKSAEGRFYHELEFENAESWYQFRSDDDLVWWCLEASEMGFVPNFEDKYVIVYDDKGTTAENKPCDCLAEYECECEVYDDEFIKIVKVG